MPTQEEIIGQQELLGTYRLTLHHYLVRLAKVSTANATPEIAHGIIEARENILRVKKTLREWDVFVEDNPDDEEPQEPVKTSSSIDSEVRDNTSSIKDLLPDSEIFIESHSDGYSDIDGNIETLEKKLRWHQTYLRMLEEQKTRYEDFLNIPLSLWESISKEKDIIARIEWKLMHLKRSSSVHKSSNTNKGEENYNFVAQPFYIRIITFLFMMLAIFALLLLLFFTSRFNPALSEDIMRTIERMLRYIPRLVIFIRHYNVLPNIHITILSLLNIL
jgi:hypothetical protein